jgi:ribosomal-protein-alanine N-acetyltransferase
MMAIGVPVEFRSLRLGDVDVLAELEREIYPQPWSEGIFRDELSRDDRAYVAAVVDDDIIGFGGLMLVAEDAHVTTLAVRPGERQAGLGTRLLLELVAAGLERGARNLTLEVRAMNTGAQRLYERFGMVAVGVRKHYYRDDDAVIMWVTDIHGPEYASRLDEIRANLEEKP